MRKLTMILGAAMALFLFPGAAVGQALNDMEELGKAIFFDEALSLNGNQSCATCHDPEWGFTGPDSVLNSGGSVYEGSVPGRFGNRKPPSAAYATQSPIFHYQRQGGGLFLGGNFWDGRATGEKLGNPAADQAQGPFLNPVEQALPDHACVVYYVCTGSYGALMEAVWGEAVCDITWPGDVGAQCVTEGGYVALSSQDEARVNTAYDDIALSIAAYEASPEANAFSSKFDAFNAGAAELTRQERRGLQLFNGKAKCSKCHISKGRKDEPALFTDYTFDNLGIPRNVDNPVYDVQGADWIDPGLGGFLSTRPEYAGEAGDHDGAHKVPTLRNVARKPAGGGIKAFGHNGYFKTLEGTVHFYNTRDVKPTCADPWATEAEALAADCWPEPEVAENVNDSELGDLKLTNEEEDAIVAFLETLSDGY